MGLLYAEGSTAYHTYKVTLRLQVRKRAILCIQNTLVYFSVGEVYMLRDRPLYHINKAILCIHLALFKLCWLKLGVAWCVELCSMVCIMGCSMSVTSLPRQHTDGHATYSINWS